MEVPQLEAMADYWFQNELAAKRAYDYAVEQRKDFVNKLVTARQVAVTEIGSDGESIEA